MKASQPDHKQLRAIGHKLSPVVTVATKGLSESVSQEIERALSDHELIKIKVSVGDRELKKQLLTTICKQLNASLIQSVGNIALVYRASEKPNPKLSNILRTLS